MLSWGSPKTGTVQATLRLKPQRWEAPPLQLNTQPFIPLLIRSGNVGPGTRRMCLRARWCGEETNRNEGG